jgi:serine/threonine protein kinase
MSNKSGTDDETPLGSTEMQALRRLAEPLAKHAALAPEELWASRYRIIETLGAGGMGEVFLVRDVLLDRLVALKVLRRTSEEGYADERRLLREARAAARAEHDRVARVYDVGTWREQSFIAMEYVRGETLRAWIKAHLPTMGEVISIIQQLLQGLQALHDRGLVHRDLKPENIMITPEGNLRILDLGIARRVAIIQDGATAPAELASPTDAASTTSFGFGVGTPGYMAPEQWHHSGAIDARADLFAVGVIAYELIAGRMPFRGRTNPEVRHQTLHGVASFDDGCWTDAPLELKTAIQIALTQDRERRFDKAESMAAALASLVPPSRPTPSLPPPSSGAPTAADRSSPESLGTNAVGISIRALAKHHPPWLVASLVTAAAVLSLVVAVRLRKRAPAPSTPEMAQFPGTFYQMGLDAAALAAQCKSYPRPCKAEAQMKPQRDRLPSTPSSSTSTK